MDIETAASFCVYGQLEILLNRQYSASDYIGELRISEAKKLLCENRLRISEIVPLMGYTHISSFTKTFKKATGITLSEYKASHLNVNSRPQ